jgi:hypothetical protein
MAQLPQILVSSPRLLSAGTLLPGRDLAPIARATDREILRPSSGARRRGRTDERRAPRSMARPCAGGRARWSIRRGP